MDSENLRQSLEDSLKDIMRRVNEPYLRNITFNESELVAELRDDLKNIKGQGLEVHLETNLTGKNFQKMADRIKLAREGMGKHNRKWAIDMTINHGPRTEVTKFDACIEVKNAPTDWSCYDRLAIEERKIDFERLALIRQFGISEHCYYVELLHSAKPSVKCNCRKIIEGIADGYRTRAIGSDGDFAIWEILPK